MEVVVVAGRRYADPDILSLIRETGNLIDPRSAVITEARRLNAKYAALGSDGTDPMRRLALLASLRGLQVKKMDGQFAARDRRDAVLLPRHDGTSRVILYNPARPAGRIAFSIAHEIAHTFFPMTGAGARFRTICHPESREANEIERLCDFAASELLMPRDDFRGVVGREFGLAAVEHAAAHFGSSFESTAFRMATAHPGIAAAGVLVFRRRKQDEAAIRRAASQLQLFPGEVANIGPAAPRYRRQSFFASEACGPAHLVSWNKSFDDTSIIYGAAREGRILRGTEALPNSAAMAGRMEAMVSPFQRGATADFPDILFYWAA